MTAISTKHKEHQMPRNVRHRYRLEFQIKSTTKAELVKELEILVDFIKEANTFGIQFGGDSGTCMVEGSLAAPVPNKTRS